MSEESEPKPLSDPDLGGATSQTIENRTVSQEFAAFFQPYSGLDITADLYYSIHTKGPKTGLTLTFLPSDTSLDQDVIPYFAQIQYNQNGLLAWITHGPRFDEQVRPGMPVIVQSARDLGGDSRRNNSYHSPALNATIQTVIMREDNALSLFTQYPGTDRIKHVRANNYIPFQQILRKTEDAFPGKRNGTELWREIPGHVNVALEVSSAAYDVRLLMGHDFSGETLIYEKVLPPEVKRTEPMLPDAISGDKLLIL